MSYIYEGSLSAYTINSVRGMMKAYPNPVELSAFRQPDFLPVHEWTESGCDGATKRSQTWGLVWKNFDDKAAGCFVFLCSVSEKQMVLEQFRDLVVNPEPFRTLI